MSTTLLLDTVTWDLFLDANGNIALAEEPYSIVQDVCSYIRTFAGECWYDTTLGVPYFGNILGQLPPQALFKKYIENAALQVPGVAAAVCLVAGLKDRAITGQVQITTTSGVTTNVSF